MADPKAVKQSKIAIEPTSTPPLPTETRTYSSPHEMSAHLLLQPVSNETEAASGIANCKVVHPAADDRVDSWITRPTGWESKRWKMSLSLRSNIVRCLSLGG
jgi:hypothetical protein